MEYLKYYEGPRLKSVNRHTDAEWRTRVAERLREVHGDRITIKFDANTGQFQEL